MQKALMQLRGQNPDVSSAGQGNAPQPQVPGLEQAYAQPMTPPVQGQTPSPFQFNPGLENQAAGGNVPMNPMVQKIMQHLGLMNLIRNRSNSQMVAG